MSARSCPARSRFLLLYVALYAGFGVLSPYLPSFLYSRDLGRRGLKESSSEGPGIMGS